MSMQGQFLVSLPGLETSGELVRYAAMVAQLFLAGPGGTALGPRSARIGDPMRETSSSPRPRTGASSTAHLNGDPACGRQSAEIRFVHAWPGSTNGPGSRRVREKLRDVVRRHFPDDPAVALACDVLKGPPVDRLLQVADEQESDLLLIGRCQDPFANRSLARRLTLRSPCSVWIVPPDAPPSIRRILVPVDFSPRAADALRLAIDLARRSGDAQCLALHVRYPDSLGTSPADDGRVWTRTWHEFREFLAKIDFRGVPVEPFLVEGVKEAHVINRMADRWGVDLIVMATRGRSWVSSLLLGSVTEQMVARTRVPLLVVKAPGTCLGLFGTLAEPKFRRKNELRFN